MRTHRVERTCACDSLLVGGCKWRLRGQGADRQGCKQRSNVDKRISLVIRGGSFQRRGHCGQPIRLIAFAAYRGQSVRFLAFAAASCLNMLGVSRLLALLEAAQLKSALLCAVHSELTRASDRA